MATVNALRYYDTSLTQGLPDKYKQVSLGIRSKNGTISA